MGSFSPVHWLVLIIVIWSTIAAVLACARILRRMGYSGWWSLFIFVWPFWVIGLVKLSKAKWPALSDK